MFHMSQVSPQNRTLYINKEKNLTSTYRLRVRSDPLGPCVAESGLGRRKRNRSRSQEKKTGQDCSVFFSWDLHESIKFKSFDKLHQEKRCESKECVSWQPKDIHKINYIEIPSRSLRYSGCLATVHLWKPLVRTWISQMCDSVEGDPVTDFLNWKYTLLYDPAHFQRIEHSKPGLGNPCSPNNHTRGQTCFRAL